MKHAQGRQRRPAAVLGVALLGALTLGGCGGDPTLSGTPDSEVEAFAIVRAERVIGRGGFDRLAVQGQVAPLAELAAGPGQGRQPRAWVASLHEGGQWRLVLKAEEGPCLVDCAVQRYWYFSVASDGEPRLEGRHALVAGARAGPRAEGEALWGFPGEEERRLLGAAKAAAGR
jgi:hypothetical protein